MKRTLPYVLFLMLVVLMCGCRNGIPDDPDNPPQEESDDDPSPDFRGTFDYASLGKQSHPRLFANSREWNVLKEKVASEASGNSVLMLVHGKVMEIADACAADETPIEHVLDASDKRLLPQCRAAQKRLVSCAYAYRITGKPKYLSKVRKDLRTVCAFDDWNPSHFLDPSEMALGVAIAYDWLYGDLSAEDRSLVWKALVNLAIIPSEGQSFRNAKNNWNQVCFGGLTVAALAVYEKDRDRCGKMIEDALVGNGRLMETMYAPDGNYPEGYMYWNYGTLFESVMLAALEHVFGTTAGLAESPGFLNSATWMLHMAGTTGSCFPFSDCEVNEAPSLAMWWFAAHGHDTSLLLNEIRLLKAGKYRNDADTRLLALVPLLVLDMDLNSAMGKVPDPVWSGNGGNPVVLVHTDWTFGMEDKYLGIKAGRASNNHGHMDAGSFVYDAYGVRWSQDLGKQDYVTVEKPLQQSGGDFWNMKQNSLRWDVYRLNNLSHSTLSAYPMSDYTTSVTMDGQFHSSDGLLLSSDGMLRSPDGLLHPSDHNVTGMASVTEVCSGVGKQGARLDMTAVLNYQLDSAGREICLEGGKLVVRDIVKTRPGEPAVLEWRMVTPSANTVSVSDGGISLSRNSVTMLLTADVVAGSSEKIAPAYAEWPAERPATWTPRAWDAANKAVVVGYSVAIPGGTSAVLTTVLDKR